MIESTGNGLRIAVNEPTNAGDWAVNDFNAFTGNRTLVSDVDQSVSHHLEMRLTYVDGPDNDRIDIYLDGNLIGSTTTFENYRDFSPDLAPNQDHDTNAAANLTDRVLFRTGDAGQPHDGPGGLNQGFNIDNLTTSVYNNTDGTGNDGDNVITGNSGDNILTGGAGNDTIDGGAGSDTAVFSGLRAQYLVTVNPNSSLHIVDLRGGSPDGTDDVSNVEFLQFADGTVLAGVNHAPAVNVRGLDRASDGRPDVPDVQSVQRHRRGQQYDGVCVLRRHCRAAAISK